jgi:hypothetical protein
MQISMEFNSGPALRNIIRVLENGLGLDFEENFRRKMGLAKRFL